MEKLKKLSAAQAILLAAHYASESDIRSLETLVSCRTDTLPQELVLRLLLTVLPESLNPAVYTPFLAGVFSGDYQEPPQDAQLDLDPVKDLSDQIASAKVRKLRLVKLHDSSARLQQVQDAPVLFLIHRAFKIDQETGLLHLVPGLIAPFADRSIYLKTWFLSVALPLLRRDYEYNPSTANWASLREFENMGRDEAVEQLLGYAQRDSKARPSDAIARDLRCLVGPWVQGSGQRSTSAGTDAMEATVKDWQHTFEWLLKSAAVDFETTADAFQNWDGPTDVDLGGYGDVEADQDEAKVTMLYHLKSRYTQVALASVYAAEDDSAKALQNAHRILSRAADLAGFDRPQALERDPVLLPSYDGMVLPLDEPPKACLQPETLLDANHVLTSPSPESFALVELFVHSALLLNTIGHPLSVSTVAKLRFWSDESEQHRLLQKLIHNLNMGSKKDETEWIRLRSVLLWLRSWGMSPPDEPSESESGSGILGKIQLVDIEKHLLQAICAGSHYQLAVRLYLGSEHQPLTVADVEKTAVEMIISFYDNASSGNKSRGGVKKAQDMLTAFQRALPKSSILSRCQALIAATHALSFYSLTLIPGIPTQPRSIREYPDPASLMSQVLAQNRRSYTKLDDLVSIGRNLVVALDSDPGFVDPTPTPVALDKARGARTERRVVGFAIEAALGENDFETAYSYVVNRLPSPSSAAEDVQTADEEDDVSWRAAFHAGRHRGQVSTKATATASPAVRQLEQRMELLSTALLLAPPAALPDVLGAWRRCEEELLTLLAAESEAEQDFDARADAREVRIPGGFAAGGEPAFMVQPQRKEIGRGAAEEAPMGLFDVARGAAAAFGRTASGAAARTRLSQQQQRDAASESGYDSGDGGDRVRRRDMVASAITGGLVSGVGWVLGAKPANEG